MNENWMTIRGLVVRGHQVASKRSAWYPRGTIEMQVPFFKELDLDLTLFYSGTLNISVSPSTYFMVKPKYTFRKVKWTTAHPPEDFSFSPCWITYKKIKYESWIYYPHPETKARHFQDSSVLEVIAPRIPDITYNDAVDIEVDPAEVLLRSG